eukprot:907159-Lingulodinium_polyedra.AAC.1
MAIGGTRYTLRQRLCITPAYSGIMTLRSSAMHLQEVASISAELMQIRVRPDMVLTWRLEAKPKESLLQSIHCYGEPAIPCAGVLESGHTTVSWPIDNEAIAKVSSQISL